MDNAQNVRNQTQNQTKPIHVSDRNEAFNRHNENEQFGYVRYQREQFDGDQQKTPVMNRGRNRSHDIKFNGSAPPYSRYCDIGD